MFQQFSHRRHRLCQRIFHVHRNLACLQSPSAVCVQWCLPRIRAPAPPRRVADVFPAPFPSEQMVKPLPVRHTVTPKKEAPIGSSPWSSQKSPSCDADNLTRDTVHVSRKVINYVLVPTLSPCVSCLECRPQRNSHQQLVRSLYGCASCHPVQDRFPWRMRRCPLKLRDKKCSSQHMLLLCATPCWRSSSHQAPIWHCEGAA